MLKALTIAALLFAPTYEQSIQQWRNEKEAALKADDGWLTVTGLHWLEPGANTAEGVDFTVKNGKVYHHGRELPPNDPAAAVTRGDKSLFVIQRGDRLAIRVRDKQSQLRKQFTGLHWYPVNPIYRLEARWLPYPIPKARSVPTIVKVNEAFEAPGIAEFSMKGRRYRLEPVLSEGKLFFIFKDKTASKTTYPAGRFLYADLPADGRVIVDFNKAYNPPCAFTPYATCPLPSKENTLPVPIEAGEKNYGQHGIQ